MVRKHAVSITLAGAAVGLAFGVGLFTFGYAKGYSYFTDDPAACINCHIMQDQYDGWIHSSHRSVASCNDCHTPEGFFPKYWSKAENGFWHSFYFTTGNHPDPIRINERNRRIAEEACRKCHADIVHGIEGLGGRGDAMNRASCLHCHRDVGHLH